MRIALVDSGLGLLATASALREARPDADLVLSMDPDHMPWGPLTPDQVVERALAGARATLDYAPDAIAVACNTASVHALEALRRELEPAVPVIGTVPAVKPAVDRGGPVSVWATPVTTGSPYQRELIRRFAAGVPVSPVACPGLADAIEAADDNGIAQALEHASARTPADVKAVVLGCTHYDLVAERIRARLDHHVELYTTALPVAAQILRRLEVLPQRDAPGSGTVTVLASGRPAELPAVARGYPAGAALSSLVL